MLAAWIELMPLFVVRWLARRHCERFTLGGYEFHGARPGIFVMACQSETELESKALWRENTGEPYNEAARELCRRWGEYDLLDAQDTPRAAQNKGK